jgi:asparagine synthase (glutamine-hydrolysing)
VFSEPEFDESEFSDLMAQKYATRHHRLLLSPHEFLSELPNALDAIDSPSADGMNTYVVSKLTRKAGVTVALSGLGGDELFAGYRNFRVWQRLHRMGFFRLPRMMRKLLSRGIQQRVKGISVARLLEVATSDGVISKAYPAFREVMSNKMARTLLKQQLSEKSDPVRLEEDEHMNAFQIISQYSIAELTHYTRDVLLKDTDQFSMASSLEVREPFFDHMLVDYVLRLPDMWKLGSAPKQLFVDAMGELLPDAIVHRAKRGFMFPWKYWLRNDLREIVETNMEFLAGLPEFNGDAIRDIHTNFVQDRPGAAWTCIWQLVALSHWIRRNF